VLPLTCSAGEGAPELAGGQPTTPTEPQTELSSLS